MKQDWRVTEKQLYLPGTRPEFIDVPSCKFFTISGSGNPNDPEFATYIQPLYALSYAIKMSPKQGNAPEGYQEYRVYPLEGVWDVSALAKERQDKILDKDQLVFTLMIRQPDFVTTAYAAEVLAGVTQKKKDIFRLCEVRFEEITEGTCVQMLHIGSYDDEPASFAAMETFAVERGTPRTSKLHREIYLSDPNRSEPAKMKTVLRFRV